MAPRRDQAISVRKGGIDGIERGIEGILRRDCKVIDGVIPSVEFEILYVERFQFLLCIKRIQGQTPNRLPEVDPKNPRSRTSCIAVSCSAVQSRRPLRDRVGGV